MALSRSELIKLAVTVAKANPSSPVAYSFGEKNYSYQQLDETLRSELKEIAGNYQLWRENKNTVFALMEEVINETLPKRVIEAYGLFADVRTYAQGEKPIFQVKISNASKRRAKRFVTKVGLAGVYEVFKLDGYSVEVPTEAFGGAAQIGFEEYLDGRVDMADVLEIINDGLDEAVYREIAKALKNSIENIKDTNKDAHSGFSQSKMDKLLQIADSYGKASIYCTFEFAATMVPDSGWVSDEQRNTLWNKGYLANYKGHNVIILPQSFEDETNTQKVIDPSYAWIIPTGADKPIKIGFEGGAQVREWENKDWSREIQTYKKFGVAMVGLNNGICVYQNTSLAGAEMELVKNAAPGLAEVWEEKE